MTKKKKLVCQACLTIKDEDSNTCQECGTELHNEGICYESQHYCSEDCLIQSLWTDPLQWVEETK